jgi:LDH2 family malate/lactate/ureidoglycolate dehydrogenase
MVSVKHSNHFGMAAMYLLRAIDAKFGAFAFTNASRAMPAWGGKEPLLGTGPMAIGLPGGREGNFVLDMSPTVAARVRNSPSKFFATVPLNAILYISG